MEAMFPQEKATCPLFLQGSWCVWNTSHDDTSMMPHYFLSRWHTERMKEMHDCCWWCLKLTFMLEFLSKCELARKEGWHLLFFQILIALAVREGTWLRDRANVSHTEGLRFSLQHFLLGMAKTPLRNPEELQPVCRKSQAWGPDVVLQTTPPGIWNSPWSTPLIIPALNSDNYSCSSRWRTQSGVLEYAETSLLYKGKNYNCCSVHICLWCVALGRVLRKAEKCPHPLF